MCPGGHILYNCNCWFDSVKGLLFHALLFSLLSTVSYLINTDANKLF